MASKLGMNRRQQQAQDRIHAAVAVLAPESAAEATTMPTHRDPLTEETLRLEWIADTLEQLATQDGEGGDPPSPRASEPSVVTSEKETDIAPDKTATTTTRKGGKA